MKRQISILILALYLISTVPAAFAAEDAQQTITTTSNNIQITAQRPAQLTSIEPRMRICADFLKKNELSDTPVETCGRLLRKELKCIDFLRDKGIEDAEQKCGRLFIAGANIIKDRPYLAQAISDKVTEARLKRVDRLAETHPKITGFIKNLTEEKAKVFLHMTRAEQKNMLEMNPKNAEKKLGNMELKPVKKTMLYKKRVIAANKLKQAEDNFNKAKQDYMKANKIYKERKALFLATKTQLRECQDVDSEECNQLRAEVQEHAKEYLVNGAKMAIEHLNKIKNKVESAEDMDEDKAAEIIAEIDAAIAELEASITELEAATTKEEIQSAAENMNNAWKKIQHREKVHAAQLVHAKVWNIVQRSQHMEEKLDSILAEMEEEGIDIDDIDAKVENFSAKIASAKDKHNESKNLLSQAHELKSDDPTEDEITQITELLNESRQLLREAHEDLKDAQKLLMEIIREIKLAGGDITTEVETEEDLEEDEVYEIVEETDEDETTS